MKRGMFGEREMAMQLEDEDLSMASVYDRISRPSSKIKQTLPFLSLVCVLQQIWAAKGQEEVWG